MVGLGMAHCPRSGYISVNVAPGNARPAQLLGEMPLLFAKLRGVHALRMPALEADAD